MKRKRNSSVAGMNSNAIGIGDRWAALLRDRIYVGTDKAKRIQRDWGISASMAYVWLAGGVPTTAQIERAQEMWGDGVIEFLFGRRPMLSVDDRLSAVKSRIAALKSGQESNHVQDHGSADGALSDLARGGERAQGRVVEGAERAPLDDTIVGWLLARAQDEKRGRQ